MTLSLGTRFFDAVDHDDRKSAARPSTARRESHDRTALSGFPPAVIVVFCGLALIALLFGHPAATPDMLIMPSL